MAYAMTERVCLYCLFAGGRLPPLHGKWEGVEALPYENHRPVANLTKTDIIVLF